MKKTYIMPLTEVVKTEVEQMLSESSFELSDTVLSGGEAGFDKASKEDLDAIFDGLW